jgi:hypothetical protein
MRRFFLALEVRSQVVSRPLPHVVQMLQDPAKGVLGHPLLRGDLQDLAEQRHCPTRMRIAEILGRNGEEGLQKMLLVFVQQRVTPPACLVLEGRRVVVLSVNLNPFVDTLPRHPKHAGNIGGAPTVVELQDGQGPTKQADILGLRELTPKAPPLPGSQVEPAHGLLLHPGDC